MTRPLPPSLESEADSDDEDKVAPDELYDGEEDERLEVVPPPTFYYELIANKFLR